MKIPKKLIGEFVSVTFIDHQADYSGIVQCSVFGTLVALESDYIQVRTFSCDAPDGVEICGDVEVCIAIRAITYMLQFPILSGTEIISPVRRR